MGRGPRLRPSPGHRPASGWLALALSVAVHAAGLVVLWFLPPHPQGAERPPALVNTCVLIADDEPPAAAATAEQVKAPDSPEVEGGQDMVVNAVVLPAEPVPADAGSPTAGPDPATAAPAAGEWPAAGASAGTADIGRRGTTFFQVAAEGAAVVYVIDCSASMGLNGGLAAARRELLASLARLPGSARFQVVAYNRSASPLRLGGRSDLVPADAGSLREATGLLARLRASGSTNHVEALRRALELEPDDIFLVTDADDLTPDQVRRVTQWNGGRAAIHAIELGAREESRPGGPLETLARSNRGTYRFVPLTGAD
jgi:hypothetical protein